MARRKKQKWRAGDIFVIGTSDEKFVPAQVLSIELEALDSVSIAIFSHKIRLDGDIDPELICRESIFSIIFTTTDFLDDGRWLVIKNAELRMGKNCLPYEDLRESGFVGAKIYGTKIVNEFVNAYFGLCAWDNWHDANYLDNLLLDPSKKSSNLVYDKS